MTHSPVLFVAVDNGFVNVRRITSIKGNGLGKCVIYTSDGKFHTASVNPTQFLNSMRGVLDRAVTGD